MDIHLKVFERNSRVAIKYMFILWKVKVAIPSWFVSITWQTTSYENEREIFNQRNCSHSSSKNHQSGHTRVECGKSKYPNEQEIADIDKGREWVPETLDRFMRQLVSSDVKIISISQCIIQAARPRTIITPILFGFGVQLEKTFGSKWLVNHLSKLGFSITFQNLDFPL